MKQRGRPKALSILPLPGKRYEPPDELTPEQKFLWRDIIATKPVEWWSPDSLPLLANYCRHITTSNYLAAQINQPFDLSDHDTRKAYELLLKMRNAETAAIIRLATAMRLTQQSRYDSSKANTSHSNSGAAPPEDKPWLKVASGD